MEVPMRPETFFVFLLAALTFAEPVHAGVRRPCAPGQREVIAKDGTTMCVNAYAANAADQAKRSESRR